MNRVTSIDDLIDELDILRAYGVSVSDAVYAQARQADMRLYALLEKRDAALLLLRRSASAGRSTPDA